ncbi:uncharacterized protein LOC114932346 [Nylanderia fulva]|uniref:uncharacterized protein LOC114932346 n=1 Tax=Nylanderia fulva TaxID=613905 RepID=UPI0010FACF3A|nr:uncharacterized protein LOC114932346 [Nylanderia fulva]
MLHGAPTSSLSAEATTRATTLTTTLQHQDHKAVLLATARVNIADRDLGTTPSPSSSFDGSFDLRHRRDPLRIRSRQSNAARNVRRDQRRAQRVAFVLPRISLQQGSVSRGERSWPHLKGLQLADPRFLDDDPAELLLGAEVYSLILEEGLRKGDSRMPIAQQTSLGWILSGGYDAASVNGHRRTFRCTADHDLADLVRRFWEQESEPISQAPLTPDETKCEELYVRTVTRTPTGRYMVRLPLASPPTTLQDTRRPAEHLLKAMESKGSRDPRFGDLYRSFMQEYEDLQHMKRVNIATTAEKIRCYLPHHGVLKEASTTTKLRVVFNGSQRTRTGNSLNSHLLTGANLLPALTDVLLRWRWHRYVFVTDIEKMYRQILVHPEDCSLQTILWRQHQTNEIQEYELLTVTYGMACAPFLAIRTLRQLCADEGAQFPQGATALRRDCYVDDVVTGADDLGDAVNLQTELRNLCMAGGFPLRKWASNNPDVLSGVPQEHRLQQGPHSWDDESHSTLGLRWHPQEDRFAFAIHPRVVSEFTKRRVLAETARLFDPMGWLAPVVIRAKILIQTTWLQQLDWDTPLPAKDVKRWQQLLNQLPLLSNIRVNRWLSTDSDYSTLQIHGFADASERGYAAAVYIRNSGTKQTTINLIMGKSKVAPVKPVSLPRLELCAAVLLTTLTLHIRNTLGLTSTPVHLWSDSKVTLHWIQGHAARWKTFVANRVAHIQTQLPDAQWRHVAGKDNPADCASRGINPEELVNHTLWWTGPTWLALDETAWPSSEVHIAEDDLPEQRTTSLMTKGSVVVEPDILLRFSALHRLLRVTAWCRRWLNVASREVTLGRPLHPDELDAALLQWLRIVQALHFPDEIAAATAGRPGPPRSSLIKLSPFLDDQGVLRVGGRLKHALLPYDEKHPVIVPPASWMTRLLIESCHRRSLHGGVQMTLGLLRHRFWVPRGRTVIKQQLHRCVTCTRWRAATPQPPMGNLPRDRAIHLEVVSDYSSEAFIAALRRFVSRRGLCTDVYSDCGTTFVGADRTLRELFKASSSEGHHIARAANNQGIRWHFNPPAAPHFGGLWEAAVKSTKFHLRRVIGETTLTYEELSTLLTQIEACLNSRPLQALSDDPDDTSALTPGHFLIGAPLLAVPEPSSTGQPASTLSRWRHLQLMRDHFWQRWSAEYVHGLNPRTKWVKSEAAPHVGDLCLIRSELTPPTRWPLARITRLHPGDDGIVRVVSVRTATSEFVRPLVKLVMLPGADRIPGMTNADTSSAGT